MHDPSEFFEVLCPIEEEDPIRIQDITKGLQTHGNRLRISIELGSVGVTNDPSNIAIDIGDALYLGEEVAKLFISVGFSQFKRGYQTYIAFDFIADSTNLSLDKLVEVINDFSIYEFPDDRGDSYIDFHDSLFDQDNKLKLRFPEIAEDYMANLLHGSWHWEDEGSRSNYEKRFPETSFDFWESFTGRQHGLKVYCSTDSLVIPHGVDAEAYLNLLGYSNDGPANRFEEARITQFEGLGKLLVSESNARKIPSREWNFARMLSSNIGLSKKKLPDKWQISLGGNIITFQNRFATHVFFAWGHALSEEERIAYSKHAEDGSRKIRKALGLDISIRCKWETLDDDRFEELCYDIISRSGKFDPKTLRKFGSSRSRDGGRDIVAFTHPFPGQPPKKWIFQCKFTLRSKSLGGSKVEIADVIDQFSAEGFCVMTNAVIDATLYDKLDAIALRRQIDRDTWSGLELERTLQHHPDLIRRYFES